MANGKSSITKRWVFNTLFVIAVVLLGVMLVALMLFKEQYYASAQTTLNSRATGMVRSFFNMPGGETGETFSLRAKEYVENFNDKTIMEVWVIDPQGHVVVSSSGFSVEKEPYPDYFEAKSDADGKAIWTGKTSAGEHVMALSFMLDDHRAPGAESGAVRYIVSLQSIDEQLRTIAVLLLLLAIVIFSFVTISGLFFIRSIVHPIKKINVTALKISEGDFSARIEGQEFEDEIGSLCQTINNMARELNETNRMKNEFISTISHELRTPLTAIKGWGETLLDTPDAERALTEKGLAVIIQESERLSHLVDELLDFSRMESGNMSMRMDLFDVCEALQEVLLVFVERSRREDIRLYFDIPKTPAVMHGDVNRIKQVFVNVLDNAFKYTNSGGAVRVKADLTEATLVKITVSDTGCGISEQDLPHVTEKFYKANSSVRGSGIGLAVVSEIMSLHNGKICLESQQGSGTTVILTFPLDSNREEPKGE